MTNICGAPRLICILSFCCLASACRSAPVEEFDYPSPDPIGAGYDEASAPGPDGFVFPPPPAGTDLDAGAGVALGDPLFGAAPATVRVARGDTLYSLSVRHLGTGRRWQEIADLNGLSEGDVRRLAVGRELRMPAR